MLMVHCVIICSCSGHLYRRILTTLQMNHQWSAMRNRLNGSKTIINDAHIQVVQRSLLSPRGILVLIHVQCLATSAAVLSALLSFSVSQVTPSSQDDFGSYNCSATNAMGTEYKEFLLIEAGLFTDWLVLHWTKCMEGGFFHIKHQF